MWFKKKKSLPEEENINSMDSTRLEKYFQELLEDYKRGIEAKWALSIPDIDDALTVAVSREELHDVYEEASKRNLTLDTEALKALDHLWQKWILERISIDLASRDPIYINPTTPKEEWWQWIEQLDKLTKEQRSSL